MLSSLTPPSLLMAMRLVGIDGMAGLGGLCAIMVPIGHVPDAPDSPISSPSLGDITSLELCTCSLFTSASMPPHRDRPPWCGSPCSLSSGTFFSTLLLYLDCAQSTGRIRVPVPSSRLARFSVHMIALGPSRLSYVTVLVDMIYWR